MKSYTNQLCLYDRSPLHNVLYGSFVKLYRSLRCFCLFTLVSPPYRQGVFLELTDYAFGFQLSVETCSFPTLLFRTRSLYCTLMLVI